MHCDDCCDQPVCDARESFIFGDQLQLCCESGRPDYRPDDYFFFDEAVENTREEVETEMNKKGTCVNCNRGPLNLVGDHCYTCYNAAKGKSGDDREKALQDVKLRIQSGSIHSNGKKPASTEEEKTNDSPAPGNIEPGLKTGLISLDLDRYPKIKSAIEKEAEMEIRTLAEQSLYILKKHAEESGF
jgi:hypothetical protein